MYNLIIERDIIRKSLCKDFLNNSNKHENSFVFNLKVCNIKEENSMLLIKIQKFLYDILGKRVNYNKTFKNIRFSDSYDIEFLLNIRSSLYNYFLIYISLIISVGYFNRFGSIKQVIFDNSVLLYKIKDKHIFYNAITDMSFSEEMLITLNFNKNSITNKMKSYYLLYYKLII